MKHAVIVVALIAVVGASVFSPARQGLAATCVPAVGPGIGAPASVPAGIPGFHAAWYGQSGYMTLCPGQTASAVVAYYNSGSAGWVSGRMGEVAYLGTWAPEPGQDQPSAVGGDGQLGSPATGWPRYNRVAVQPADYVGPGQVAWFQFTLRAPMTPGTYRLGLRPLIEGTTWMEDYGVFWIFTVLAADGSAGPSPTPTPRGSATPTPTATATPIATPTGTPPVGGAGFVGDASVEASPDASGAGQAEANRFVASTSGSVTSLSIYLDASNQATSFAVGLYSDGGVGGGPGSLLAQNSRAAVNASWNTVVIPATTVTSGTAYWIARLSTAGGSLVTRVGSATNADRVDTRTGLTSLPTTFSAGATIYQHITSMYAGTTAPNPTPTPTPTSTPPSGAFTCTELDGFSQTGNIWSLQRTPNDAFESVVDGTRYQLREADGGAISKWADPSFTGWLGNPTSPCTANSLAPDRLIMDITESFWIGDPCGSHTFDDCTNPDTSVARVAQDIRNYVATARAKYPSLRQIYLMPLVGGPGPVTGPSPGTGQCYVADSTGATHPIRGIWNSPLIAQAIAQAIPTIPGGITVLQTLQWGVRTCADFYDDGQYVGHLSPYNDAKPAIGQMIGNWFAARP